MKTLLRAVIAAAMLPASLLLGATAVLVAADYLDLPVMLVDAGTGRCVAVKGPADAGTCANPPERYHREIIAPIPAREFYRDPPAETRGEVAHR